MFWKKKELNEQILREFIKGMDRIISRYGEDGHETRVNDIKIRYREKENNLTGAELDTLNSDIMDLYVRLNANLSGEGLAKLRQDAIDLLKKER